MNTKANHASSEHHLRLAALHLLMARNGKRVHEQTSRDIDAVILELRPRLEAMKGAR